MQKYPLNFFQVIMYSPNNSIQKYQKRYAFLSKTVQYISWQLLRLEIFVYNIS